METTPQAILRLDNIQMAYQNSPILHDIHLTIHKGDFLALIGPSGAGKSTLLRLMNLLEAPTNGEIYFENALVEHYNDKQLLRIRRQMTMVMQRSVMLAGTVSHNVATGLKLRKLPESEIKTKVAKALDFVGMADFADRKAGTLSGGEMQRVALARAIALEPALLFLDEPTANLDPQNVAIVEALIQSIKERLGTTVVIVTHNLFQAKRMADQVAFLHQGKLIEQAPALRLFSNPEEALTQEFISGTMVY